MGDCGVLECIILTGVPNILSTPLTYKILETLFKIMPFSTPAPPTATSIIKIKENYHFSDNVEAEMYKLCKSRG